MIKLLYSKFILTLRLIVMNPSPLLSNRLISIVFPYSAALSLGAFYIQSICTGIGSYSGLFQLASLTQSIRTFINSIGVHILIPWAPIQTENKNRIKNSMPMVSEYSLIILYITLGALLISLSVYILSTLYKDLESATIAFYLISLLGCSSSEILLLLLLQNRNILMYIDSIYNKLKFKHSISETNNKIVKAYHNSHLTNILELLESLLIILICFISIIIVSLEYVF